MSYHLNIQTTAEVELPEPGPGDLEVAFMYKGKSYTGLLIKVPGAGGETYQLMGGHWSYARLWRTATGWQFSTQKAGYIPELAEYFGTLVNAAAKK